MFDFSFIFGWFSKIGLRGGGNEGKGQGFIVLHSCFGRKVVLFPPPRTIILKALIGKYDAQRGQDRTSQNKQPTLHDFLGQILTLSISKYRLGALDKLKEVVRWRYQYDVAAPLVPAAPHKERHTCQLEGPQRDTWQCTPGT